MLLMMWADRRVAYEAIESDDKQALTAIFGSLQSFAVDVNFA
jgi:hypothetical protein